MSGARGRSDTEAQPGPVRWKRRSGGGAGRSRPAPWISIGLTVLERAARTALTDRPPAMLRRTAIRPCPDAEAMHRQDPVPALDATAQMAYRPLAANGEGAPAGGFQGSGSRPAESTGMKVHANVHDAEEVSDVTTGMGVAAARQLDREHILWVGERLADTMDFYADEGQHNEELRELARDLRAAITAIRLADRIFNSDRPAAERAEFHPARQRHWWRLIVEGSRTIERKLACREVGHQASPAGAKR